VEDCKILFVCVCMWENGVVNMSVCFSFILCCNKGFLFSLRKCKLFFLLTPVYTCINYCVSALP
jgi:hypothetical protein